MTLPRGVQVVAVVLSVAIAVVAYAAMLGLGLHRHGSPWAISLVATSLVFGPAAIAAALTRAQRARTFAAVLAGWSLAVLSALPVYFPGERRQAVTTGLSLVGLGERWEDTARTLADQLPAEPPLATPELPEATALVAATLPPPAPLEENQISLPYEGENRRLAVPVAFNHEGATAEAWMMLDTGATYTTLPASTLAQLGIVPGPSDPVIRLHTANGEREAHIVLLERVWLGDLSLDGVAIATCEACASSDTVGLLGLNVTSGYNLYIDADRQEVVFTQRADRDQRLDVGPFVDLSANFVRFPGGRIEVEVKLHNNGPRSVRTAHAAILCGEETWIVEIDHVAPGEQGTARRRLPDHPTCDHYQIALDEASW